MIILHLEKKISFLKRNIEGITEEQVEEYNLVLAKLLRWVNLALELRSDDVVNRRDNIEYMKQDRNAALAAEAAR